MFFCLHIVYLPVFCTYCETERFHPLRYLETSCIINHNQKPLHHINNNPHNCGILEKRCYKTCSHLLLTTMPYKTICLNN